MCTSPLYAFEPRSIVRPSGEWRLVHTKFGWKRRFFSGGEIAPAYGDRVAAEIQAGKKPKVFQFCKDFDSWNYLKENEPDNKYYQLPCGQCIQCRLKHSREWALRLCCENAEARNALFVTLTYDDDHLPLNDFGMSTLVPKHYSKFIKDLRNYASRKCGVDGIRFFAAGEYGSETKRAHFHLILFNLPQQILDDLKFYRSNFNGDSLYNSPILEKLWNRGFVVVAPFSFRTAAYVARYVTKKLKGIEKSVYIDLHLEPEFAQMSRRPGIGRLFYVKHKEDLYFTDEVFLPGVPGLKPARYFDKLYDFDSPLDMERVKFQRALKGEYLSENKLSQTDLKYDELLRVEERSIFEKIRALKRGL